MKIVVTDGITLNPGDLSWDQLQALGDCDIYERSTCRENLQRCADADIAITNKVLFDKGTIDALPKLKCIAVTATGYNVIDTDAAKQRGIVVCNVPTYGTDSVAQMVFALLLELTLNVGDHSKTVHEGKWSRSDNFCYWDHPLIELAGLTIGIVGYGRIGQAVAKIAAAFGMKVLVCDVIKPESLGGNIEFADIDTVFANSDVISLHCPLTSDNTGFVNTKRLEMMKPSAFLINTSRGPLINETDLAKALNSNKIAGAALDVLSTEPPKSDNPLLTANNCFITPHIAWATRSARQRLMSVTISNIKAFINGSPENIVP